MAAPITSPTGHAFGKPRRLASDPPGSNYSGNQPFQPVPPPVGIYPYHLDLASVLGASAVEAIRVSGKMDFHVMGDSGGINAPLPQTDVAAALEADVASGGPFTPSFLYLLGDCVYFNGQPSMYYAQFYEPYTHYNAPIVAVPGNHDGDPIDATQSTLDGFLQAFCTVTPQNNPVSLDSGRTTMTQPNVYWTLDTPFATIVGLYTNVPEHGRLDDSQIAWLKNELRSAPAGKALLVTMHHPPISADSHHGSSQYMFDTVDQAVAAAGRAPSIVLAGHVHNYQRFTRTVGGGAQIPYVVAGAGGYHTLHTMASDAATAQLPWDMPGLQNVTLDAFDDKNYGFARVTVTPTKLSLSYVQVAPEGGVAPSAITPRSEDTFTLDLNSLTVK